MSEIRVTRLSAQHAPAIMDCVRRVYGESYANEVFYDRQALTEALERGRLRSVGAWRGSTLVAHMAMTLRDPDARSAELGNTLVDPQARGGGVAWRVGAELTAWCTELGYAGFLHYPTTDHHIVQQQSIKRGIEVGLMLGYIPAETDGQVHKRSGPRLRGAATIVFEPLTSHHTPWSGYLPARYAADLLEFTRDCGLERHWLEPTAPATAVSRLLPTLRFERRGLTRFQVQRIGSDIEARVQGMAQDDAPCVQVDLGLDDPGVDQGIEAACALGFEFCGWLPGFRAVDVLRLQKVDPAQTDLAPNVVNATAQRLLAQRGPAQSSGD